MQGKLRHSLCSAFKPLDTKSCSESNKKESNESTSQKEAINDIPFCLTPSSKQAESLPDCQRFSMMKSTSERPVKLNTFENTHKVKLNMPPTICIALDNDIKQTEPCLEECSPEDKDRYKFINSINASMSARPRIGQEPQSACLRTESYFKARTVSVSHPNDLAGYNFQSNLDIFATMMKAQEDGRPNHSFSFRKELMMKKRFSDVRDIKNKTNGSLIPDPNVLKIQKLEELVQDLSQQNAELRTVINYLLQTKLDTE